MSCKLWLPIFLNEQRSTIYQAKAVIARCREALASDFLNEQRSTIYQAKTVIARRHDEAMTVSA